MENTSTKTFIKENPTISYNSIYDDHKKYYHMSLFSNEAFLYQLIFFIFVVSNVYSHIKVLLNDTKFNLDLID